MVKAIAIIARALAKIGQFAAAPLASFDAGNADEKLALC